MYKRQTEHSKPIINDSETAILCEARQRFIDELARTSAEISKLKAWRDDLSKKISALNVILDDEAGAVPVSQHQTADAPQSEGPNQYVSILDSRSSRQSPELSKSVDAAVEVLRREGPLHYRDIYAKIAEMGVSVIGKDPAATLLSRFSRDPRIRRISSGTYAIQK